MSPFELGAHEAMIKIAYGLYELPDHMRGHFDIKHKNPVLIEMKDSQISALKAGGHKAPKRASSKTEKAHWKARAAQVKKGRGS